MLTIVFISLAFIAVAFTILAFLKRDNITIGFFAFIIYGALGMSASKIETPFCEYNSGAWECIYSNYTDVGLIYLFGLFAIAILVFSIINAFTKPMEEIAKPK